jgi:hypothetical protein
MSDATTPVAVEPSPKPPRTWRTWQLVTAAVVALLLGIGIGGASGGSDDTESDSEVRAVATTTDDTKADSRRTTTTKKATTTTEGPYYPAPGDFALSIVVLEQSCFGSAGCNITYEIDLAYKGPRPLDSGDAWTVIYEIRGGENVKVGNISVQGDRYSKESDTISTDPNPRLEAVPTAVREG